MDRSSGRLKKEEVEFSPALLHIFEEILINAADNTHRSRGKQAMTYLKVRVDANRNTCSFENDGASIPIVKHRKEKMYVPQLIFGHLLTSSNYDDKKKRFVGGRHGFGAKLTNIFSKIFVVEIMDGKRGKYYRQEYKDNMSVMGEAQVEDVPKVRLLTLSLATPGATISETCTYLFFV